MRIKLNVCFIQRYIVVLYCILVAKRHRLSVYLVHCKQLLAYCVLGQLSLLPSRGTEMSSSLV